MDKMDGNNLKHFSLNNRLIYASRNGLIHTLKEALKDGADPNAKDASGTTSIIESSYRGYTECVALLIASDADIHAETPFKRTALSFAASKGNIDCMRLLIIAGARTNRLNGEQKLLYNNVVKRMDNDNRNNEYSQVIDQMRQNLKEIAIKRRYEESSTPRLKKYLKDRNTVPPKRRPRIHL